MVPRTPCEGQVMIFSRCETSFRKDGRELPGQILGPRRQVRSRAVLSRLVEEVTAAMKGEGYPPQDVFALRLALEEAGVNAFKHGRGGDPAKRVWVAYQVTPDQVLAEVEDEGPGFDPARVPDPLAEENLERSSGRGIYLMRCYLTWLRYNDRGNRVTLCRRRTAEPLRR